MIVAVDAAHVVRLEHPHDFKRFHVEIAASRAEFAALQRAFAPFGTIDDEQHAWIDAGVLRAWPGLAGDAAYQSGLAPMLDYAARKGWMSPDGKRVRAHIVWTEPAPALGARTA